MKNNTLFGSSKCATDQFVFSEPRIFVVDDDPLMLATIVELVRRTFDVEVAEYSNGAAFLRELKTGDTGCLISDYQMEPLDGLALQKRLQEKNCFVAAILVSGKSNISVAVEAMENGAVTFLEKPFDNQQLIQKIEEALSESRRRRFESFKQQSAKRVLSKLSDMEMNTLRLCIAGKSNRQIANRLDIGLRTVERYKRKILDVTGLDSMVQLPQLLQESRIELDGASLHSIEQAHETTLKGNHGKTRSINQKATK